MTLSLKSQWLIVAGFGLVLASVAALLSPDLGYVFGVLGGAHVVHALHMAGGCDWLAGGPE